MEQPQRVSPLFGDVLVLSYPGVFEVIAKLVPEHEDITRRHFFLPSFWLSTKVAHHVLETGGESREDAINSVVLSHAIKKYIRHAVNNRVFQRNPRD